MQNLTAPALAEWLADPARPAPILLDVREPWEVQTAHIAGITPIPLQQIPTRGLELDQDAEIVCICHHGGRSAQAAMFLEARGYTKVHNLQGGVDAWARQVDGTMQTY
ncbi:rhodanese-like domain-containing protein [Burkholderia sp. L27(2015)]|jgi:rhodanese-related sulfurtransferase|uniref:rhodanese-like domain-containing protein n=1 Tax=Burkholderia sp. L27(2015) TaxID=1641858 RepID=UPI00131B1F28|nr:rhodanese-like domain-containing protein [Burkholderia sp. L27(2015)]